MDQVSPTKAPAFPTWGLSSFFAEIISLEGKSVAGIAMELTSLRRCSGTVRKEAGRTSFDLKYHSIRENEVEEQPDQDQIGEHDEGPRHIVPNDLSLAADELAG